jgi:hypothetical protein
MKKNRFIITVLVILLVFSAILIMNNSAGTFKKKDKDFAVQDTATVTKIFLADKRNRTILLERTEDGSWNLNNTFMARKSGIDVILETMKNLVAKFPVPKSAHNSVVAQMAAAATKVEVYQEVYRINLFDRIRLFKHEKLTKTFYVGGATPDNMGTFMLMEGSDQPFVIQLLGLRGYIATRFSTFEKDWRDHTVFKAKLYDIQSVEMQFPGEPENSYKVVNRDENITIYSLSANKQLPGFDTLKVLNFLTSFTDLRYEALLDEVDPQFQDSVIHSTPQHIITLVNKKGDTTSIKTFLKSNDQGSIDQHGNYYGSDIDRMFALINDERDFVVIQYFVFDKVLRPLSFFVPTTVD